MATFDLLRVELYQSTNRHLARPSGLCSTTHSRNINFPQSGLQAEEERRTTLEAIKSPWPTIQFHNKSRFTLAPFSFCSLSVWGGPWAQQLLVLPTPPTYLTHNFSRQHSRFHSDFILTSFLCTPHLPRLLFLVLLLMWTWILGGKSWSLLTYCHLTDWFIHGKHDGSGFRRLLPIIFSTHHLTPNRNPTASSWSERERCHNEYFTRRMGIIIILGIPQLHMPHLVDR